VRVWLTVTSGSHGVFAPVVREWSISPPYGLDPIAICRQPDCCGRIETKYHKWRGHTMKTRMNQSRINRDARDPSVRRANATRRMLMGLALALAVIVPQRTLAASPVAVDLGSASTLASLAGASVGPQVDNGNGASNVLSISAILTGTLTSDEGLPTQVRAYWGIPAARWRAGPWRSVPA